MTELLKDTLRERADAVTPATPDLGAIMGAGRSRVRRRRAAGGLLAAAVLVGAAIIVPSQLGVWGAKDDATNVAANEARQLTWAEGSVIHAGSERIDVGREVNAFVETARGYVFTDPGGTVFEWEDGEVMALGRVQDASGERDLVSDGGTAAWLDVTDGEWTFAYTEASGVVRRLPVRLPAAVVAGGDRLSNAQWRLRDRTRVMALDQHTLYAGDQRGILAFDLRSGDVDVLSDKPEVTIADVEDGTLLFTDDGGPITDLGTTYAAASLSENRGTPLAVDGGDISPGARYVMSENSATSSDDFEVVALQGSVYFTPPEKKAYDFFTGYAWIDEDRYLAFGLNRVSDSAWEAEAMTCSAPRRSCDEPVVLSREADVDGEGVGFQLPIGEHLG